MEGVTILHVGEREFNVDARSITERFPDSYLAELFTKNPNKIKFFIDRDGGIFEYLLYYLRSGKAFHINLLDIQILSKIITEAEFFRLPGLTRHAQELANKIPVNYENYSEVIMHVQERSGCVYFDVARNFSNIITRSSTDKYQEALTSNLMVIVKMNYAIRSVNVLSNKEVIPETLYVFEFKK